MGRVYDSRRWRKKREHILRRDGYMCQYFKRYGRRVDADTVHHIYPVEEYPEYAFCDWNLISLSNKAHEMMHDRENDILTVEGEKLKKLADKRRPKDSPPPVGSRRKIGSLTEGGKCFQ